MNAIVKLTSRESQVAELFAWGAAKKDIANSLFISERTVENHARTIYDKVGCSKVNELSAWWFCTHFNISFDLSPLKRTVLLFVLLAIIIPQTIGITKDDMIRTSRMRVRTASIRTCRTLRNRCKYDVFDMDLIV